MPMRTLINCLTRLFAPGRYTKSLHERNFTRASSPSHEESVPGGGIASVYEAFALVTSRTLKFALIF